MDSMGGEKHAFMYSVAGGLECGLPALHKNLLSPFAVMTESQPSNMADHLCHISQPLLQLGGMRKVRDASRSGTFFCCAR